MAPWRVPGGFIHCACSKRWADTSSAPPRLGCIRSAAPSLQTFFSLCLPFDLHPSAPGVALAFPHISGVLPQTLMHREGCAKLNGRLVFSHPPYLLLIQTVKLQAVLYILMLLWGGQWEVHKGVCESNFIKSPLWCGCVVSPAS